jgi:hypothetical protein
LQQDEDELQRQIDLFTRHQKDTRRRRQEEEQQEERFASTHVQNIPQAQVPVFQAADRDEYIRVVPRSRRRATIPQTRGDYDPLTENL